MSSPVGVEARVRRRFLEGGGAPDPVARLEQLIVEELPLLGPDELRERARGLAAELVGLGRLELLLAQPGVTDVLVNGPGPVWVERHGRLERTAEVIDRRGIERAVERLVAPLGLRADRTSPVVDARLPDGTRVSVVLPPLAVDGPVLALRRHDRRSVSLDSFADHEGVEALHEVVRSGRNVVVYGPTGSGKTTLLGSMCRLLPPGERLVTIEDVAELQLGCDHVVRLEARPGTADGVGRAGIRDLVRAALRLRPDRIVVGEVRGPEALDMVWALSTGHSGGLSTCHAARASDALARLESMCLLGPEQLSLQAVRDQVRSAVDVLVGVGRDAQGRRRVLEVREVSLDGPGTVLYRAGGS